MNVSLTPELEKFVNGKVESGLYNNASEVVREGLRLLKEYDEFRARACQSIERGWARAQSGDLIDGPQALRDASQRLTNISKRRPGGGVKAR
jgi:antitoxin ParD1/3/4